LQAMASGAMSDLRLSWTKERFRDQDSKISIPTCFNGMRVCWGKKSRREQRSGRERDPQPGTGGRLLVVQRRDVSMYRDSAGEAGYHRQGFDAGVTSGIREKKLTRFASPLVKCVDAQLGTFRV